MSISNLYVRFAKNVFFTLGQFWRKRQFKGCISVCLSSGIDFYVQPSLRTFLLKNEFHLARLVVSIISLFWFDADWICFYFRCIEIVARLRYGEDARFFILCLAVVCCVFASWVSEIFKIIIYELSLTWYQQLFTIFNILFAKHGAYFSHVLTFHSIW